MAPKPKIEEGEKQWEDPDIYIVQSEQETAKPKKQLNPALANILAMLKSSVQKMENDLSDARKKINNLDSELAANLKAKLETPIKTDPGL
jgi:predicted P-loop ATPase/GTPase